MQQVTQADIDRIKELAFEIHKLSQKVEDHADILFALAVATSSEICMSFPREQWAGRVGDQLKLLARMISEFPDAVTPQVPSRQN
jgi:hypothetical protein